MTETIILKPVEMTPENMQKLEDKGLIVRLYPGHHILNPARNESQDATIYASDPRFGPHKLIAVTINAFEPRYFGSHEDNEEFLLIGDPTTKPLYLIVATCKQSELDSKIQSHKLLADDFIALRVKYNDPEVSFFTMLTHVPHGEVTVDQKGQLPSFYVTEPRDLITNRTNFGPYLLKVV
jgi:hypothetical protein